jgi:hypothetical protein
MYDSIKLDKSMYTISNKSFVQCLAELDPDSEYIGTALEGLDAYERQLKRFDIKVSGANCDKAEKFFTSAESAVLFPEFVRRAVTKGINESRVADVVATVTKTLALHYNGAAVTDAANLYSTGHEQGDSFPVVTIKEQTTATLIKKYGRTINSSYEFVRNQRLELLGVILSSIGKRIGTAILFDVVNTAQADLTEYTTETTNVITYNDLIELYGKFDEYRMTTILTAPSNVAKIIALEEMRDIPPSTDGRIFTPFGVEIIPVTRLSPNNLVGIDKTVAMELITTPDVIVETDRLIATQMDQVNVSFCATSKRIFDNAVKVMVLEA